VGSSWVPQGASLGALCTDPPTTVLRMFLSHTSQLRVLVHLAQRACWFGRVPIDSLEQQLIVDGLVSTTVGFV
jgi:hypothetical protein